MLDTLAIARTLTDAGMDRDQAAAVTARHFRHYSGIRIIPSQLLKMGGDRDGCRIWTRNNHRLFKKARTSSSGRYRFGGSCEGVVLAIAFSFSLRSACR